MLYTLVFVKASTYRSKIMLSLAESAKTPKQLSQKLGIHQNNVSATLKQLKMKGLIRLINPDVKRGRIYELTDVGLEIAKELK